MIILTYDISRFLIPGGNIFALDKLLIPINIQNHHFFTIGVFFQSRIIQVFDSKPDTSGRLKYLEHIFQYLKDEQETTLLGSPLLVDWESWSLTICSPGGGFVPTQGEETNDCGVFTCLFMDYLMLDLSLEQVTQEIILKHGREHVCSSILNKLINF